MIRHFVLLLPIHWLCMYIKLIMSAKMTINFLPYSNRSTPSGARGEDLFRPVRGGAGEQQHHWHGSGYRGSRRPLHPHPPLRHVQVPQPRRRLLPRRREPQLHQQLSHTAKRQRQGQTAGHRQDLQKQEEQRQGVLRLRRRNPLPPTQKQTNMRTPLYITIYVHK